MVNINIDQWDEQRFYNERDAWNKLLSRSSSDQLFLSWEWLSTWWKVFSDPENMTLNIFVATTDDGRLVGIAPLFSTTVKTKHLFTTRRLQFIGNLWRGRTTMLTELLDFIVDSEYSTGVISNLYSHINDLRSWDEFVIPFLDMQSDTYLTLVNENALPNCYLRHAERYGSYYLKLDNDFQSYTKNLGKNTRLKLLNRRSVFEKLGDTSFVNMQNSDIEENFQLLNDLHSKRWGKPIFEEQRLTFNTTVAKLFAERDSLNFSTLLLDNKPVSIQYNFVVNNHNYNIQAGFDEDFHKKISLGYLHFGYEIEFSFKENFSSYNFLAGEGKNTQYKERLTETYHDMTDLQIIRNPILKLIHMAYSQLKKIKLG